MTPEQEDALVRKVQIEIIKHAIVEDGERLQESAKNEIRLAIRAAYAQGREDAAKVCIKWGDDQVVKWDHDDEMREYNKSRAWDALQCAAAIRSGE